MVRELFETKKKNLCPKKYQAQNNKGMIKMNGTAAIQQTPIQSPATSKLEEIKKTALTATVMSAGIAFFGGFKVAQVAVKKILGTAGSATEAYLHKQAGTGMRTIASTTSSLLATAAGATLGYYTIGLAIPFLWTATLAGTGVGIVSIAERSIIGSEHTHQFIDQFDMGGMVNYILKNLETD